MKCLCINNKNENDLIKFLVLPENINKKKDENNLIVIGMESTDTKSYAIRIDEIYQVYGILIYSNETFYLMQKSSGVGFYNSKLFKIIDGNFNYYLWSFKEYIIEEKPLILIGFDKFTDYNNLMALISGDKTLIKSFLEIKEDQIDY